MPRTDTVSTWPYALTLQATGFADYPIDLGVVVLGLLTGVVQDVQPSTFVPANRTMRVQLTVTTTGNTISGETVSIPRLLPGWPTAAHTCTLWGHSLNSNAQNTKPPEYIVGFVATKCTEDIGHKNVLPVKFFSSIQEVPPLPLHYVIIWCGNHFPWQTLHCGRKCCRPSPKIACKFPFRSTH